MVFGNLKGCTVTIDAMGCQKDIAEQIRKQGGHYVFGLKGNQPTLEASMQQLFEDALNRDFAGFTQTTYETHEKGHGRIEDRTYQAIEIPEDHPQRTIWRDLRTLVIVTSCRTIDDDQTWETRWYITSP